MASRERILCSRGPSIAVSERLVYAKATKHIEYYVATRIPSGRRLRLRPVHDEDRLHSSRTAYCAPSELIATTVPEFNSELSRWPHSKADPSDNMVTIGNKPSSEKWAKDCFPIYNSMSTYIHTQGQDPSPSSDLEFFGILFCTSDI